MTTTTHDNTTWDNIDVGALATDANISRDRAKLLLERFGSIEAVAKNAVERPSILTEQPGIGEATKTKVQEFGKMFLSPVGGTYDEDGPADHVDMSVIPDPMDSNTVLENDD